MLPVQCFQASSGHRPVEVLLRAAARLATHPLACIDVRRQRAQCIRESFHTPTLDEKSGHIVREDVRHSPRLTRYAGKSACHSFRQGKPERLLADRWHGEHMSSLIHAPQGCTRKLPAEMHPIPERLRNARFDATPIAAARMHQLLVEALPESGAVKRLEGRNLR